MATGNVVIMCCVRRGVCVCIKKFARWRPEAIIWRTAPFANLRSMIGDRFVARYPSLLFASPLRIGVERRTGVTAGGAKDVQSGSETANERNGRTDVRVFALLPESEGLRLTSLSSSHPHSRANRPTVDRAYWMAVQCELSAV